MKRPQNNVASGAISAITVEESSQLPPTSLGAMQNGTDSAGNLDPGRLNGGSFEQLDMTQIQHQHTASEVNLTSYMNQ